MAEMAEATKVLRGSYHFLGQTVLYPALAKTAATQPMLWIKNLYANLWHLLCAHVCNLPDAILWIAMDAKLLLAPEIC